MENKCFLVLNFDGLSQSYGEISTEKYKGTRLFPTKSAVVGLLGCALGYDRRKNRMELAELSGKIKLGIRMDRSPFLYCDFQSVSGYIEDLNCYILTNKSDKKNKDSTLKKNPIYEHIKAESVVSGGVGGCSETKILYKEYLDDAAYTVVIESDEDTIKQLHYAIRNPKWTYTLGRYNCIPSRPIYSENDIVFAENMIDVLSKHPLPKRHDKSEYFEVEIEDDFGDTFVLDEVLESTRVGYQSYGIRNIRNLFVKVEN